MKDCLSSNFLYPVEEIFFKWKLISSVHIIKLCVIPIPCYISSLFNVILLYVDYKQLYKPFILCIYCSIFML
jgi:hypothetical protein